MKKLQYISLLTLLILISKTGVSQITTVSSPDKETRFELNLRSNGDLQYRALYSGEEIITWSQLGFDGNVSVGKNTVITSNSHKKHAEKILWSLGENDVIKNNYNELNIACQSGTFKYNILVRAFNGSIAFRYVVPAQAGIQALLIKKESTEFNFTSPYKIYQYHHETVFTPTQTDTLKIPSDLPSTLTNEKFYLSIGEANNDNYTKAELKRGSVSNSVAISFERDSSITANLPFQTPWRTISVSKTAVGLHQFSELFLKLNPSSSKKVPDWIKPGKLMRAQLNTQSGLDCIDLAKKLNFQYIMFDAGWYGAEFRGSSDPTQVIPQIDMPKVIQYGKDNGIGVILYVNYVGLKAKLDTILPLYKQWGIKGLKFGFVDGFSQKGIQWLKMAIEKVNKYGFILDIHDNYKPTGLSRTYPALLTQEGIRGDENSPDAFHNTVLPFTRFLAGPADFTYCFPNPTNSFSRNIKVSKAQQLALTVVYFSPLQAIFWYGQPKDYTNLDEIEFFKYVPTTWNQSLYLKGEIGENISVARRKGNTWFIGNAAGLKDWSGDIQLNFLDANKKYTATVYEDSSAGGISKRDMQVVKGDIFPFDIKAKGGQAIIIRPSEK